jgi:peptidoglycan hydrolase-like protein with peptidoglycan-binding domain
MPKVSTRVVALATVVGSVLAAASTASAALNLPTQSCNYVFTANLKAGMRNAEVRNLQKVLNAYPQTMVAASGAGSTGMETDYFGSATKAAVIKFQSINGVTPTSGNVFSLTRAVLNQVCNGSTPTTPTTPSTSGNVSVMLSANQPTNVLVAGQATARLADFTFSGVGTVTNVKFMRTGVSSNDTLANVYLFDNGMRIAGPASVATDGSINFGSISGLFNVNGSKTVTVRSDIKAGVSGQSVGVTLTGYTVSGASMASTMVAGTQLPVANVTLLGADFPTGNSTLPSVATIPVATAEPSTNSLTLAIEFTGAEPIILTVRPCSLAARVETESERVHTV